MRRYTQITQEERRQIYILKKEGYSSSAIAVALNRHKSTIARVVNRNSGLKDYRLKQAHRKALIRQKNKACRHIGPETRKLVEELLHMDWSPEQISGWLKKEGIKMSHEWIYRYILKDKSLGGNLYRHLRCRKPRKKRYGSPDRRGQMRDRTPISERPPVVDERIRMGDWEVDTVIGKPGGAVLATLVERETRFSVIVKSANKTALGVKNAIISGTKPFAEQVHTLTYDNGKEFALHMDIAKELDADGHSPNHIIRGSEELMKTLMD